MKVHSTRDVVDTMEAYLPAAALMAALEMGLFWHLTDGPEDVSALAAETRIPRRRCRHLLRLLADLGLLESSGDSFALSAACRTAIIEGLSQESWAMYARDTREHYPLGLDLGHDLRHPGTIWSRHRSSDPDEASLSPDELLQRHRGEVDYVRKMAADARRAELFTRMLYEIHAPVAEYIADTLDLDGVRRVMDLGGGSGVVSLALLRRCADLEAVVVEIPTVCDAGRAIADETPERERITFHAADFLHDDLPTGFDLVVECDVGVYGTPLFAKLAASLNPGGQLLIIDRLIDAGQEYSGSDVVYGFRESLNDPDFTYPTLDAVTSDLRASGFDVVAAELVRRNLVSVLARRR